MGAGKTTLGKKLAVKLGYTFVDVDLVLEQKENKYIRDIIADHGEVYFREKETETLKELDLTDKVISTGGGTPCFYDNMQWMNDHGITIFVDANEGVIFSRLVNTNRENRPLLKGLDDEGLKKFIHNKLEERMPFYTQANIKFDPIRQTIRELAELLHNSD
ncbi:MAG: shikimate kinase [Bacteroidetes bacterium]|nr:shikimate kinase [Bacteroidota bacterium]